jgi:hypothetical protein
MEAIWWALKTRDAFSLFWPVIYGFFIAFLIFRTDFVGLLVVWFWRRSQGKASHFEMHRRTEWPSGLVIIPSLCRDDDDFNAITITVDSCATNGYKGDLVIIASVDGRAEKPEYYSRLQQWCAEKQKTYPENIHVYVGGNDRRMGKMMAVESGVELMKVIAKHGTHPFPTLYYSMDGDGTLGEEALERLADRLLTPYPISGNKRRVVSSKPCIRPDLFWHGWTLKSLTTYFTLAGHIYRQVAREFVLGNTARFNWTISPKVGVPGGLYCCWAEILLNGPRYHGFMQSITFKQWMRWWVGLGPPKFSESKAEPIPEALIGPGDDTCMCLLSIISSWQDGKLSMDPPRTPFHAFGRLIRLYLYERVPDYAPEARVFTYTPNTIKGLWNQRIRWNTSRFECGWRFKNASAFHWEVGFPMSTHLLFILYEISMSVVYYILLPYYLYGTTFGLRAWVLGYTLQVVTCAFYTCLALLMERKRKEFWPVLFILPLAPVNNLFNLAARLTGVTKDLLIAGNTTKFAPEWTLKKSRNARLALYYRTRRFLALCVRAVVAGDVPFGSWWFGWHETRWTPSGYDGWTTGKPQRAIVPPVNTWFRGWGRGLPPERIPDKPG